MPNFPCLYRYLVKNKQGKEGKAIEQEKVTISLEEKVEKVKDLRPIDDVFFEVLADDIPFCQEMLRILLEDENLVVKDVIV